MAIAEQETPAFYNFKGSWDDLPITPELDIDELERAKKATRFRSRYSQSQHTIYELNRYGGKVGDVMVRHEPEAAKSGYKAFEARLEFANPDPEFQNIDPADYHTALWSVIGAVKAANLDLHTIELSTDRTDEDPSGLKMAGAAWELVDLDVLDEWEFKIIPPGPESEQGEARYLLKRPPPYGAIGSTVLGPETNIASIEQEEELAA